jgi:hypothetical protein
MTLDLDQARVGTVKITKPDKPAPTHTDKSFMNIRTRKRIESARKSPAYRLGFMEAVGFVSSNVMSPCQPYRDHDAGTGRELAAYVMSELEGMRKSYGIDNKWESSTGEDRDRQAIRRLE